MRNLKMRNDDVTSIFLTDSRPWELDLELLSF